MAGGTLPLVGRDRVLADLRAALDGLVTGAGGAVVVEGPAGIGKSRVLAEAVAYGAGRGLPVAAGRVTELDWVAPLTTLLGALSAAEPTVLSGADLAALRADTADSRFRLVDRLGELIERYSQHRPLVVCLDDVQWADELTALVLGMLVPTLGSAPVLWLLARRPVPARAVTGRLVDRLVADGARHVVLEPLPDDAVAELCGQVVGAVPRQSLLDLVEGSGGNPFLLESLLTSLRDGDRIRVADGTATVSGSGLPAAFLAAVDRRLRDLPRGTRRLLDAASVFGRPFTLHEVAGLLDRPPAQLLDLTADAIEAGVLVDTGSAFAFRHDLVREALYGGLPGASRLALHRIAASVLHAAGRPPAEVAQHLVSGAQPDDRRTLRVVAEALTQVAPSAPGAAADLVLGVLDGYRGRDPERVRLIAEAVALLASAGRLDQARDLGERYLERGLDAPDQAAILLGLAEALKHAGQDRGALGYTGRALRLTGVPDPLRARLFAIQAHALLMIDDLLGAEESGAAAGETGTASGEHSAVVFAAEARSVVAYARGDLAAALDLAQSGVAIAERAGGEALHRHPLLWHGMALTALDRFDEAADAFAADKVLADELGTAWSRPLAHHMQALLWLAAGKLDDAEAVAEAGVRFGEQTGAIAVAPPLLATLGLIALRRGDLPGARRLVRRAQEHVADGIGVLPEELLWEVAVIEDAAGHPDRAVATLAAQYGAFPRRIYLLVNEPIAGPQLVRTALRAGDRSRAAAAADATAEAAARNPGSASLAAAAAQAGGLLTGDPAELRAAADIAGDSPRPYLRASTVEDAAAVADEPIPLLERALTEYAGCGARWDADRVRRRLSALGVRMTRAGGRRRPRTGWASLTDSELAVARLVAEGRTNRQIAAALFLSPHTVDSHIRHAFAKLGIARRVELTRQVLANDRLDIT